VRSRGVRPEFWKHEGLADVPREVRLFYIGLWGIADCEGKLEDRTRRIKAELFPYDDDISSETVGLWLALLHEKGFVIRYAACGGTYVIIPAFRKWQWAVMSTEERKKKSLFPNPSEYDARLNQMDFGSTSDRLQMSDGGERETGDGRLGTGDGGAAPPPPDDSDGRKQRSENRQQFIRFLSRLRVASDETAVEEWLGLAVDAGAKGFDLVTACVEHCVRKARKDGVQVRYARQVETYADEWRRWNEKRQEKKESA
jgi:hypothetical protein